jgi:hypothetical protein
LPHCCIDVVRFCVDLLPTSVFFAPLESFAFRRFTQAPLGFA